MKCKHFLKLFYIIMMSLRFFTLDNSSMETDDTCMSIAKDTFEFYDDIFCKCTEIPKFEEIKNKLKEKEEVISVQYSLAQKPYDRLDYIDLSELAPA